MAYRVKRIPTGWYFPSSRQRLSAVVEQAPRAEALAVSFTEKLHPLWIRLYCLRRRIATLAVASFAGLLFVHVMFGANGMIVYKQKRAEYERLRQKIVQEQKENELDTQRIRALQTDEKAIEKEAREQLHYARPGEIVYVPSASAKLPPPASHTARK